MDGQGKDPWEETFLVIIKRLSRLPCRSKCAGGSIDMAISDQAAPRLDQDFLDVS